MNAIAATTSSPFTQAHRWKPINPMMKSLDMPSTFSTTFEDFPRDFLPSKAASHLYKHFYPHMPSHSPPPNKYVIHKHHKDESSWLDNLNPFECDSENSDEYDSSGSDEYLTKRKSKLHKYKHKHKKKKKKKILLKFILGFLAFIAIKVLLEKIWVYFPAIFPTTGRDELLEEMDHLLDEGIDLDRANNWKRAIDASEQNRAYFAPNYEETRIDFTIPIKRRIFTNF